MNGNYKNDGFTLLEVMIAMAILAMSLTILLGSINSGVLYGGNARDQTIATFLAQQKMTELERKRGLLAVNSDDSGQFEDEFERFSWRYSIVPDESAAALAQTAGVNFSFDPMKVEVVVTWKQGKGEASYVLQEMIFPVVSTTITTAPIPSGKPPGPTPKK